MFDYKQRPITSDYEKNYDRIFRNSSNPSICDVCGIAMADACNTCDHNANKVARESNDHNANKVARESKFQGEF